MEGGGWRVEDRRSRAHRAFMPHLGRCSRRAAIVGCSGAKSKRRASTISITTALYVGMDLLGCDWQEGPT